MIKFFRLAVPIFLACLFVGFLFYLIKATSGALASRGLPSISWVGLELTKNPNLAQNSLVVDTLLDETTINGKCSLREAIQAANTNTSVDTCASGDAVLIDMITFSVLGTITVTSQLEVLAGGPLEIDGSEHIIISGDDTVRIMHVKTNANLSLYGLDLVNGNAMMGGGIYNQGKLLISNNIIAGNHAGFNGGGGIYNDVGNLTISESIIFNNIGDNKGGGIMNNGTLTITHSTIDSNAAQFGGGIDNTRVLTITNSIVSNNNAGNNGGGITNMGKTTIISSTLAENSAIGDGGGMINNNGLVRIIDSTLLGNYCTGNFGRGGGIDNGWTLLIINSTVSNNTALGTFGQGGGIDNSGTTIITNSTFLDNKSTLGGSTINTETMFAGGVTLSNSIVAGSLFGINCAGTITDGGHNIEDSNTCGFTSDHYSLPNTDPILGPLQDNGGPTWTYALSCGPAIDAANDAQCPPIDQRGVIRPLDGDGDGLATCDIGSYEYDGQPCLRFFLPAIMAYAK